MKKLLLIALTAGFACAGSINNAAAQKFELGARAGIGSQNMDVTALGLVNGKNNLGWNLAAVGRIRMVGIGSGIAGAGLFFQPEVVYAQNNLKGTRSGADMKVAMKTVDIPLLLSLKVSLVRVQAGPVFNLMNNFESSGALEMLPIRKPVGYAVGASVDLLGLTFDARYHGEFNKMEFKGESWKDIKSSFSSWSLGVGIMF